MQAFALEHPFITFFIITSLLSSIVRIVRGYPKSGEDGSTD